MELLIRTLGRDEADLLDDVVARLSPHSRYRRFHSPVRVLGSEVRRALSDVDGRDRIGLVAEVDDGSAVGIAHMIRNEATGGTEAEVALAAADAWQRRGVGRALVTELAARARTVGVESGRAGKGSLITATPSVLSAERLTTIRLRVAHHSSHEQFSVRRSAQRIRITPGAPCRFPAREYGSTTEVGPPCSTFLSWANR